MCTSSLVFETKCERFVIRRERLPEGWGSQITGIISGGIAVINVVVRGADREAVIMVAYMQVVVIAIKTWLCGIELKRWAKGVAMIIFGEGIESFSKDIQRWIIIGLGTPAIVLRISMKIMACFKKKMEY